jgi:integrase
MSFGAGSKPLAASLAGTASDANLSHGRHTFISHALAGGRTLGEVKAAAGHASLLTTSVHLHVVLDEREQVGELFATE